MMTSRTNHRTHCLLLTVFLMAAPPAFAQADADAYGDDYARGDYGRVRYLENGVTIQRAASDLGPAATEEASANAPIFPGDTVLTARSQRAEIQLAGGSLVRADQSTELTFLALPAPYEEFTDNTVLQLGNGAVRISSVVRGDEEFRLDTPAASVYLLGDGDFRVEVDASGRTLVLSRRGVAEVVGNGGSVLVRGGNLAEVGPGQLPAQPEPFNTFLSDNFDRWVEQREAADRVRDRYADSGEVYEQIPEPVRPYYGELSRHGDWGYETDYGWVWYPSGVGSAWRPYSDGYWAYGRHGYFWVANESWGWAPYHYGRWAWTAGRGWCWVPGRVFAGAWVAWSWGSIHVGWSALDYWNRPCYVGSLYYGYYDHHAWTFVDYGHLHHRHYNRYAVSVHQIGDSLRHNAVVTRPPAIAPRDLATSKVSRERAVRQARGDVRSQVRPVVRGARPSTDMRQIDDRLSRRVVAEARKAPRATPNGRRAETAGTRPGTRPGSGSAATSRSANGRAGREMPQYRRRITSRESDEARVTPRGNGSRSGPADGNRSRATTTEPTRRRSSADASDRVRDLYNKMARPRTTREQTGSRERPSATGRTPSSDARRPAAKANTPSARPRPSSASTDRRPSASKGRSGSSASKGRSSGSSSRSRPSQKARPAPKKKKESSPNARLDRSSERGPTRATTPSRSRDTTPRARSGGSSSRRAPARATTPSRPRSSAPKARAGSSSSRRSPARASSPSRSRSSAPKARAGGSSSRRSPARSGSGSRSGSRSSKSRSGKKK